MSPTPARTSRDAVLAAARALLEEGGLDAVTMATVAKRVGVRPASLYKHVRDRQGLIGAVVEGAALELGAALTSAGTEAGADPRARAEALAHAYRGFAAQHPRVTALLFADLGPVTSLGAEASGRAAAPVLDVTTDLVGPARALPAARVLVAFVHGFTSMEAAGAFRLGGDIDAAFEMGVALLAEGLAGPGAR